MSIYIIRIRYVIFFYSISNVSAIIFQNRLVCFFQHIAHSGRMLDYNYLRYKFQNDRVDLFCLNSILPHYPVQVIALAYEPFYWLKIIRLLLRAHPYIGLMSSQLFLEKVHYIRLRCFDLPNRYYNTFVHHSNILIYIRYI